MVGAPVGGAIGIGAGARATDLDMGVVLEIEGGFFGAAGFFAGWENSLVCFGVMLLAICFDAPLSLLAGSWPV